MQHIGKALKSFIQSSGLKKVLDQQKLIDDWDLVVGEKVSENAKATSIEHGVLKAVSYTHLTLPTILLV